MDGKNIADFIDPDIAEKLEALEREEETLEAEGFYDDRGDGVSPPVPKMSCHGDSAFILIRVPTV